MPGRKIDLAWFGGPGRFSCPAFSSCLFQAELPTFTSHTLWKPMALAHRNALKACRSAPHGLDWTYIRQPFSSGTATR